jgi:GT2 family glycosyltransferase
MDCQILAYENQPNNPEVSLVVPLYGRIDFVQYQLSLFADDPDLQKTQLIYILDDPRLENELFELSSQLSPLFKVPFQVIYTGQNLGYARANNLAVKHAQGKYIILLNSDVMPCEIGWITTLKNFYEVEENIGALGPTLIYEDNSIQHRGITPFRVPPYQYLWFNDHPGKGQPNFQCLVTPYLVPAVTGACLLVSRRLYLECGGLCDDYILGDFEDSDFCLKLLEKGLNNYCYPQVELYHLERQSQSLVGDPGWRQSLTLYNSWLYTQKWDSLLQEIVSGTRGDFSYE